MPITATAPVARPTLNTFDLVGAALVINIRVQDAGGTPEPGEPRQVRVQQGSGIGLAYDANGNVVRSPVTNASITMQAAFNAYASAVGGAAAKELALLTWMRTVGLLPA